MRCSLPLAPRLARRCRAGGNGFEHFFRELPELDVPVAALGSRWRVGRVGWLGPLVKIAEVGQYRGDAAADFAFLGQPELGEDGIDVLLDRGL